jgi:hypothetical protein
MDEVKTALINFLKSLRLDAANKRRLDADIFAYSFMPTTAVYLVLGSYSFDALIKKIETDYNYRFSSSEIEKLTKFYHLLSQASKAL